MAAYLVPLLLVLVAATANAQIGSCLQSSDPALTAAMSQVAMCQTMYSTPASAFVPTGSSNYDAVRRGVNFLKATATRSCLDSTVRMACLAAFPPCVNIGLAASAVPAAVPADACTSWQNDCGSNVGAMRGYLTTTFNVSASNLDAFFPLSCNATAPAPSTTYPALQTGESIYPAGASQQWIPSATEAAVTVRAQVTPALLGNNPNVICYMNQSNPSNYVAWLYRGRDDPAGYCVGDCPVCNFTYEQWNSQGHMMIVLCWFQLVLCLWMVVTRALVPAYRVYPANLSIFFLIPFCVHSFAKIWSTFYPNLWRGIVCGSNGNLSVNVPVCTAQAAFNHFGITGSCLWWAAIAVHSAVTVWRGGSHKWTWHTHLATHIICWGLPILCMIILGGLGIFNARPTVTFCYLLGSPSYPQWVFHWDLVLGSIVVGIPCMVYVIVKMFSVQSEGSPLNWKTNLRALSFLAFFCVTTLFTVANRFMVEGLSSYWAAATGAYISCSIQNDGCVRGIVSPYAMAVVFNLCNYSTGLFVTLIFMCNKQYWSYVWQLFTCNWSALQDSSTGTTAGSSTGTSSAEGASSTFTQDY